jgi:8-oxo-dGTP pyrophosphatase MutT (NUDIX family)/nucleoside 2-deoxyribosyltransferase
MRKVANNMQVIYAQEEFPKKFTKSIFLAGPTPRDENIQSWRTEALDILQKLNYDGVVFVPEPRDSKWEKEYDKQVDWERKCLDAADCIVFWIPRDLETMPAFTTNVEFGLYLSSGKIVAGAPKDAPKNTYLQYTASKSDIAWKETLEDTLKETINFLGEGSPRIDGECFVPLIVWNTEMFQKWYKSQKEVGNKLVNANVKYLFKMPKAKIVFLWICQVEVWIKAEDRIKSNEFVLSRTDMSSVVLYYPNENLMDTKIVLVKEFRSPVVNAESFVYEIPGGSSNSKKPPLEVATSEVNEEVGVEIDSSRLKEIKTRQAVATLSAHQIHSYALELTEEELKQVEEETKKTHGVAEDTELTYVEIKTLGEILDSDTVDWTNIGMIMSALIQKRDVNEQNIK